MISRRGFLAGTGLALAAGSVFAAPAPEATDGTADGPDPGAVGGRSGCGASPSSVAS